MSANQNRSPELTQESERPTTGSKTLRGIARPPNRKVRGSDIHNDLPGTQRGCKVQGEKLAQASTDFRTTGLREHFSEGLDDFVQPTHVSQTSSSCTYKKLLLFEMGPKIAERQKYQCF